MRIMLSGGAPLSRDTHEFLRVCFGASVIQGYGLTETCGGGTLMHIDDVSLGAVGAPLPGAEIKLIDVPEMGYLSSNEPQRGEVWIKGPMVATRGYYKKPEQTAEAFKAGGWFATGDVGQFNTNGTLEIIDRVKNLVKLSHGEYIPLESIESKLKTSPLVDNICVYADSSEAFPIAIVFPAKQKLTEYATSKNLPDAHDFNALCEQRACRDAVLQSLNQVARASKLKSFEVPKDVLLTPEEWTPENYLTAAMKLKRAPLTAHFKAELAEMYKSLSRESS